MAVGAKNRLDRGTIPINRACSELTDPDKFEFDRKIRSAGLWGRGYGRKQKDNRPEITMSFRITGLDPAPFRHLYGMSDADLSARNVRRHIADRLPGFPDRVELRDAEPGKAVLLLNYTHQPEQTPYRSSHAIFIREGAEAQYDGIATIPDSLRSRLIALRAFDARHDMIAAEIVEGTQLESMIEQFFDRPETAYLHAHYARRGCYAARIDRV